MSNHVLEIDEDLSDEQKRLIIDLLELTNDERADIFNHFCKYCGSDNPKCQCWNDE